MERHVDISAENEREREAGREAWALRPGSEDVGVLLWMTFERSRRRVGLGEHAICMRDHPKPYLLSRDAAKK